MSSTTDSPSASKTHAKAPETGPDGLAMPKSSRGTAVVVGASSGMGEAVAMRLAVEGRPIALVARRGDKLEELAERIVEKNPRSTAAAFPLDVADLDAAETTFAQIEERLGPVEELFFLAGVMPEVGEDEFDTEKDRLMFQVNTLGCVAWCNAAARRFQARQRGRIIGVTSVAGDRGRRGRPGYCASKAGQDTFLESLRNRLWRHGVRVTTVRPGFVTTPMTEHLQLRGAISADEAARLILRARDKERSVSYIPFKWWPIMTVVKAIPSFVFRRLSL
jgi:decaprenylphospho-beta-D-erythro-pentofuranosid-2-ulose 2-reductase